MLLMREALTPMELLSIERRTYRSVQLFGISEQLNEGPRQSAEDNPATFKPGLTVQRSSRSQPLEFA